MIYRSNLIAPDVSEDFSLLLRPRPWSLGHTVASDPLFEPECCFMTHDEAAILYHCARAFPGTWVDIGARLGWTSAHIAEAGNQVLAVDPALADFAFRARFHANTKRFGQQIYMRLVTSTEHFRQCGERQFAGVCIDGNHDAPEPLNDARHALDHLADTGILVFHDFWGRPIREAVEFAMAAGLACRVYDTPNGLAVCWRGAGAPPRHQPDPAIDWAANRRARAPEFDFSRCS